MKKVFLSLFLLFTVHWSLFTVVNAADMPTKTKLAKTPEGVEKGRLIYYKRCSFCHGLKGDGDGPAAEFLDPRPRDFTVGTYKFRTTQSGELPTDEDLFRVISRGLNGTAMQTFDSDKIKNGLTEEERWQVIYYIQTFYSDFANPDFDPSKQIVKVAKEIPSSSESIAKGKKIFQEMKCWECHGDGGRGNGPNSPRLKDKFRKDPILPFDLTKGWRYKAGSTAKDIYMRFNTGLNGTPMPSFTDSLNDEERWHLANFVVSLQKKEVNKESVLQAKPIKGELPSTPDDQAWDRANSIDVQMAGQVIAKPRWENPSVDIVAVKALYNDKEIAFLMEWGDRFKDTAHNTELEYQVQKIYTGYTSWEEIPRKPGNFRDSIAIQFPVKTAEGTKKPHFFRGDSGNPVNLWMWKADLEEAGSPSVEEVNAAGTDQPLKAQPVEGQQAKGKGIWKDGVWRVVIKRPLTTEDKNDVQFEKGKFIPFALNAWDGSNGEHNLLMSLSTWNYVIMEAPVPIMVYLYTLLGIIGIGGIEWWLVKKTGRRKPMFQNILTALDNSPYSDYGMDAAISIARVFKATVTGCHVYAARLHETRFMDMESGLPERYQSEAVLKRQRDIHESLISKGLGIISDSYMDRFEKRCQEAKVDCLRKNREGKNFAEILKEIEEGDYDLTVMGSLGMGVVENSIIGGVCERVARKARKDMLILKDNAALKGNILVAIDGSPYSYWGLMIALSLKKIFHCEIEAVAAFDPYFHQVAFRNIADALSEDAAKVFRFKEQEKLHDEIIDKGMAKLYEAYLNTAAKIAKARDMDIKTTLLAGKAYNEIIKHIQTTKPSLLMLGRFGLHHVPESDMGSNAENLLRLAPGGVFLAARGFNPEEIIKTQTDALPTIEWTERALKRLEKVPPFAKGMAKKAIEDYARGKGQSSITEKIMDEAANKLLPPSARRAMGIEE